MNVMPDGLDDAQLTVYRPDISRASLYRREPAYTAYTSGPERLHGQEAPAILLQGKVAV